MLAAILAWGSLLHARDLVIFAVMYLISAFGVTVGFHRLLTHRAFETHRAMRYAFAIMGSYAVEGPVLDWVADHRKHHTFTDEEGDPHSPHVGQARRLRRRRARPLARARRLAVRDQRPGREAPLLPRPRRRPGDAPDQPRLPADRARDASRSRSSPAWPGAGRSAAASRRSLWAGLVRIFLVHHVTWSINSICHFFGARRFETGDHSTNVFWLALPSLGEAWHHNHHAFPRSAFHGLRWYELDPSGWLILAMAKVGLAWDVVRIDRRAQRAKLAGAAPQPADEPAETAAAA